MDIFARAVMISFNLTQPIPSLNVTLKEHWAVKKKRRDSYEETLKWLYVQGEKATKEYLRASIKKRVRIHSQRARKLDYDNLVGGAKTLIDALKRAGMIVDDSPEWLEVTYTQATGKPYHTLITFEELPH
jgi:Holliday junction resolvase RusA-like endonuclease